MNIKVLQFQKLNLFTSNRDSIIKYLTGEIEQFLAKQ
jgi:hypothetical protein